MPLPAVTRHTISGNLVTETHLTELVSPETAQALRQQSWRREKADGSVEWLIPETAWMRAASQVYHERMQEKQRKIEQRHSVSFELVLDFTKACPDRRHQLLRERARNWLAERGRTSVVECPGCQQAELYAFLRVEVENLDKELDSASAAA